MKQNEIKGIWEPVWSQRIKGSCCFLMLYCNWKFNFLLQNCRCKAGEEEVKKCTPFSNTECRKRDPSPTKASAALPTPTPKSPSDNGNFTCSCRASTLHLEVILLYILTDFNISVFSRCSHMGFPHHHLSHHPHYYYCGCVVVQAAFMWNAMWVDIVCCTFELQFYLLRMYSNAFCFLSNRVK